MVCSAGWPNVACRTLLRQLRDCGAALRCDADFDPAGVLIVRHLEDAVDASPWRMDASDYVGAAGAASLTFEGSVADTPWSPALASEMRRARKAVVEEQVPSTLVESILTSS